MPGESMAADPEAAVQLARLLGEERLAASSQAELTTIVEQRFDLLVDGLVAEAAASDDVLDRESALEFVRLRLERLSTLLDKGQRRRLAGAINDRIEAW